MNIRFSFHFRRSASAGPALFVLALLNGVAPVSASPSLGLNRDIVAYTPDRGAFPLVTARRAAPLFVDGSDFPGVRRAAADLQADIERVSGVKPELVTDRAASGRLAVIIGTLGKSAWIDTLAKSGKINVQSISGKWESFVITTVANPLPGVEQALVIAGSDRRGTIYGIYEISEQIGVSPWYWWADVPAQHHDALFIKAGTYLQGPPVVKYRGIFINDENPALSGWSKEKFGGVNSKMYVHMFELLLRLRANYLWPAMWGKAFNEDDPETPRLADEYGIVMGTSHHEPLMRAQQEWTNHRRQYGSGQWNYLTNKEGLQQFWADGVERNKNYENIYTMGMRGDGDIAMPDAGGLEANKRLLETIIADQREIIARHVNPDPSKVPQLWALFTEVQQYYDAGLRVPDDVTLLFTDDNVGDLRRVLTPEERKRSGGAGVYFHMDMNGGPFSYKWINSNPLPKVWEQMNLAVQYGVDRIWIANVGDLKPLEIPLEFFIRMGWDPAQFSRDNIADYQKRWAEREFGKEHAAEIADIVARYAKYNNWRKPELVRPNTYSLVNYREAERVSQQWNEIVEKAETLYKVVPKEQRDAFYQLVLHPAKAGATLVDLYIEAGRNALFAQQLRASTNSEAARVRELYKRDQDIGDYYNHELAGGKWDHMMDQIHIGYTNWQTPRESIMPKVTELTLPDIADFGVAVEGSTEAWPGSSAQATLPPFDSLTRQRWYIEVFARGKKLIEFKTAADKPWITIQEEPAPSSPNDRRLWVDIDWSKAPAGQSEGAVTIGGSTGTVVVKVSAAKATVEQSRQAQGCLGGLTGPIAFTADQAAKNVPVGNVRWEKIPDYGRGPSAMEVFPVTAAAIQPPNPAPRLEYPVFFAHSGNFQVDLITGVTLDMFPGRGLGVAVSLDDGPLQVVNVFTQETTKDETNLGRKFQQNTENNARVMHFTQTVEVPGKHTLKITMVDPTVVVQSVIVYDAPLPQSYFGPPASGQKGAGH
jgi:hypothetical protein